MGRHSARSNNKSDRDARRGINTPTRRKERHGIVGRGNTGRTNNPSRFAEGPIADLNFDSAASRKSGTLERAPKRLRNELQRRRHRTKKIMAGVGIGLLVFVALAAAGGFAYWKYIEGKLNTNITGTKKLGNLNLTKTGSQAPYNLLIMGYDKRKADKQYRSDTMLLARIDPKKKKIWMISLPRDYRVQIPGYGTRKLNAAYVFGQEKLVISTVEALTGQKINHYMGVDFTGFKKIVDAMGGIEVNVPYKIDDPKADYTAGHTASVIDKGVQILDGSHALTFVRTRAFPDADITRMKNQQIFFKAVADTAAHKLNVAQIPGLVTAAVPYMSTDMSLMDLIRTARDLRSAGSGNMYTTSLPGTWISPFLVPDETEKAAILKKFEEGVPFDETAAEAEAKKVASLKPAEVKVTVRNGTTKVGAAKQAASVLETRGFGVGEVGNTDQQNVYNKTMVIYKTSKASAQLVAKYLQPDVQIVQSRGMYTFKTETMVIIGKDWDINKLPVTNVNNN
ncbi:MAG: LCP family protein [Coriobacteriia bacterium]|nr:LCP family protein [Coriobacteriia bacterium]